MKAARKGAGIQRCAVCSRKAWRRSFSLMELLVVFSTIMVLMALLLPAVQSAMENTRKARCASSMRQYGMAFRLYQNDHKGMYPDPWVNNADNWQSYLCGAVSYPPWFGPNAYLPPNWHSYQPSTTAKRVRGEFLCPTMVRKYDIPMTNAHDQWGYCIATTRIEISYQNPALPGGEWPWFKPEYRGADLDTLYPKHGISGVMTCGNAASWNSDNNWDAFNSVSIWDWVVQPAHGDITNLLFMDGHVEAIDVTTQEGRNEFNYYWYNAIPTTMGNPW